MPYREKALEFKKNGGGNSGLYLGSTGGGRLNV